MSVTRKAARPAITDLALLQREINHLFERLAEYDRADRPTAAGEWQPCVDVYESRGRLVVVAEVPGLAADSLRVVCRDHALEISGERRERRPPPGIAGFLCMERPHGRFRRTIPLDAAVDVQKADARVAGGVLTITIPRLKDRRGRETVIPVEREQE
jgi:HSP20 family protein